MFPAVTSTARQIGETVIPYCVELGVVYFGSSMIPDEAGRRKWQNPESTLLDIGLRPSLASVDIGCGDGFFALPAARIVGATGRVYAVDEDSDAIDRLRRKARIEGIGNLEAEIGKAEDTVLCEECADMVFFGIVLHDFEDPGKGPKECQDDAKDQWSIG